MEQSGELEVSSETTQNANIGSVCIVGIEANTIPRTLIEVSKYFCHSFFF